jgi:hypothetical protein
MGHKIVFFGRLRPARSRQDEPKEVREVGSKRRTSSRGNGGHVVWWIGLIFRLLPSSQLVHISSILVHPMCGLAST